MNLVSPQPGLASPLFDPQAQPVLALPEQPALNAATLDLAYIRNSFTRPVRWQVEPRYGRSDLPAADSGLAIRPAAVFMPLVQRPQGVQVLFTRRAASLPSHAGQICFPGGCIEPGDRDPAAAALRETREEIGISPEFIELMGRHPEFITRTRFAMTPIIGALKPGFILRPDAGEVAEVFEVPLSVLMDPARHRLHEAASIHGGTAHYFSISWQSYFIWGATAALVRNFYRYLLAAQSAQ